MTGWLLRDAWRIARAGGWELLQPNYNHLFYGDPDREITKFLGRLFLWARKILLWFFGLYWLCAKWCLCLRLWGKGLSLLASRGRIFTAYLMVVEISLLGNVKTFWVWLGHSLAWHKHAPWGAKDRWTVPAVPGGAQHPSGVGDGMARGQSRRQSWAAPCRSSGNAGWDCLRTTSSCCLGTASLLEKYFFQFIYLSGVKSNYWNIAQFFNWFFFCSKFYLCSAFMFLF